MNNIIYQTEEIRNWPGPGNDLKRTVWQPSGQVGTSNAVSDASYVFETADEKLP
jgi:hypothetical protein